MTVFEIVSTFQKSEEIQEQRRFNVFESENGQEDVWRLNIKQIH